MATSPIAGGTTYVDFGRAFQFYFEDPDWVKKTLWGCLFYFLAMFLVGAPFLAGYGAEVTRRAARGEPRPLPEWENFGQFFMEGLLVIALYLAHFLAAAVLPASLGCLFAVIGNAASNNDAAAGVATLGLMVSLLLFVAVLVAVMLYFPAAYLRMVVTGRFGAGFEVRENIDLIKRGPGNYLMAIAIYIVTYVISYVLGIVTCLIGSLPSGFWSACVGGWALGEVARRDPVLGGRSGYADVFA